MSININTGYGTTAYAAAAAESQKAEAASQTDKAAALEQGAEQKQDGFEKTPLYKTDIDKVNAMKTDLANNMSAFRMMVQGLFKKQGDFANSAFADILEIDQATQDAAIAAIADDGEWGTEATAGRILEFAKALTGGDPDKIEAMRGAFEKGFKAAEEIWGGKLPDISYKTYDRVMRGFDEWANGGGEFEEASAE